MSLPVTRLCGVQCFLCSQPRYQSLGLLHVPLPHQLARLLPGELLVGPFFCAFEGQFPASGICDADSQQMNACDHAISVCQTCRVKAKLMDMSASSLSDSWDMRTSALQHDDRACICHRHTVLAGPSFSHALDMQKVFCFT